MAIIFGLMKKIMKPKGQFGMLVTLLFYSSITTMIFGILFGSYFGETFHPILFSPLDNPVAMLIFSLVIGVLHIFSGMAIKIVEQVRAGHVLDAIFDQVSWMLLIAGAGLIFLEQTRTVGMVLAIVGAVIILFTAGREKKNIVGKAFGGIMGLYDVTSYLSDILCPYSCFRTGHRRYRHGYEYSGRNGADQCARVYLIPCDLLYRPCFQYHNEPPVRLCTRQPSPVY